VQQLLHLCYIMEVSFVIKPIIVDNGLWMKCKTFHHFRYLYLRLAPIAPTNEVDEVVFVRTE
jgi:hypothetical protein